nr:MAG TPA: hypothetical protein [Caudoviricetes sp.]
MHTQIKLESFRREFKTAVGPVFSYGSSRRGCLPRGGALAGNG